MRTLLPLLAVVLVGAGACGSPPPEEHESAAKVPVEIAAAGPATVTETADAAGIVAAAPGAELTVVAPQPARIAAMPRAEGDTASRGDLLVRFDIPSAGADLAARGAELTQARARAENARAALTRVTGLYERGVAARKEVEEAERDLKEADAAIAQARHGVDAAAQLASRREVRAPFNGVVVKRWRQPGDLVEAASSDPVLRFVDLTRVQVDAQVAAADAPRVHAGQHARVSAAGASDAEARVLTAPALVDAESGTSTIRLAASGRLPWPVGTAVRVRIVTREQHAAVTVPASAIVRDGDTTSVFVVDATQHAHRRQITTGSESVDRVEILNGVAAGDRVIVRGQAALPDGAEVAVEK
jgi:RND family efflux transporter MFP subunit